MSVLRSIEHKIESLFEGVFGRAFRTNVQPVELARKLVKEMEDHRVISVSRMYVPNEYTVYLCPQDREQFASYEESLIGELQDYLAENARREKYVMLSAPEAREAAAGGQDHPRLDRARVRARDGGAMTMTLASIAVEEALLLLKIAFLVLLYLFIWRIVRTATRDLRLPQESFVLAPSAAAGR